MVQRLYLGEAFGWESKSTTKVAVSQLREKKTLSNEECAKSQAYNNRTNNLVKTLGYIPLLNIVMGALAIHHAGNSNLNRPHHKELTIIRGVSMILFGPLLIPVDAIKTICDKIIAAKYAKKHPELMAEFNCPHKHTSFKDNQGTKMLECQG